MEWCHFVTYLSNDSRIIVTIIAKTEHHKTATILALSTTVTGSRIRAFDWCQNERLWMTLNGHYARHSTRAF